MDFRFLVFIMMSSALVNNFVLRQFLGIARFLVFQRRGAARLA